MKPFHRLLACCLLLLMLCTTGAGCLMTGSALVGAAALGLARDAVRAHTVGPESPTPLPRRRGFDFYTARELRPATHYDPYADYDFSAGNTGPRRR